MTLRGMALTRRGGGPSGTMIIDFVFRFDSDSISDYVNYSTRSKAVCKPYGPVLEAGARGIRYFLDLSSTKLKAVIGRKSQTRFLRLRSALHGVW